MCAYLEPQDTGVVALSGYRLDILLLCLDIDKNDGTCYIVDKCRSFDWLVFMQVFFG